MYSQLQQRNLSRVESELSEKQQRIKEREKVRQERLSALERNKNEVMNRLR